MKNKTIYAAAALGVVMAVAPACASKKFVRTEVGSVNAKVDTLSASLEETQERTRQNETRISAVDEKAIAAGRAASEAGSAASAAAAAAIEGDARLAGRVDGVETTARRLIYEVTLSEDQGNFTFADAALPAEAKARLDHVIGQLKADPKGVFIEIEGHTDSVGDLAYNTRLGLARADSVRDYLYQQHQVPLHKINVISYGEAKPVAPNDTRAGRAQNRRVVVRVLS